MGKGLERAAGGEALGSRACSQQQAVPPPSSEGQEPDSSHRDYPRSSLPSQAPALPFPLLPAFPRSQPRHKARVCQMCPARHGPTFHPRLRAPQQRANTTPGIFHREQTHRNGGWRAEIRDTPTTAAKLAAMSQFAREVFKNAENSPGAVSCSVHIDIYLLRVCIWARAVEL